MAQWIVWIASNAVMRNNCFIKNEHRYTHQIGWTDVCIYIFRCIFFPHWINHLVLTSADTAQCHADLHPLSRLCTYYKGLHPLSRLYTHYQGSTPITKALHQLPRPASTTKSLRPLPIPSPCAHYLYAHYQVSAPTTSTAAIKESCIELFSSHSMLCT